MPDFAPTLTEAQQLFEEMRAGIVYIGTSHNTSDESDPLLAKRQSTVHGIISHNLYEIGTRLKCGPQVPNGTDHIHYYGHPQKSIKLNIEKLLSFQSIIKLT